MEKLEILLNAYKVLRDNGIVHTQKEFASKLEVSAGQLSKAMQGDMRNLSANLVRKAELLVQENCTIQKDPIGQGTFTQETILVLPTSARAGTLGDFAESVQAHDCERIISPIKGADFAIQVTGDSMSPEYPNGSQIIIKKIDENQFVEWGKVYVLDTPNGAIIKQVKKTDKPNVVECISLNPDYQSFYVNTDFINGWYRVLMCLSLK